MAPTRARLRRVRRSRGKPVDRIWQAMRILQLFTAGELAAVAGANSASAARYCRAFAAAGYLAGCWRKSGRTRKRMYRLVRDTGPLAPHAQIDGVVYDRNLACEFPPEHAHD